MSCERSVGKRGRHQVRVFETPLECGAVRGRGQITLTVISYDPFVAATSSDANSLLRCCIAARPGRPCVAGRRRDVDDCGLPHT